MAQATAPLRPHDDLWRLRRARLHLRGAGYRELDGTSLYEHSDYGELTLRELRGGQVRDQAYEVAQRQSQNGLNSPTERPTNLHIAKVEDELLWTSVRDPDGFFRVLTQAHARRDVGGRRLDHARGEAIGQALRRRLPLRPGHADLREHQVAGLQEEMLHLRRGRDDGHTDAERAHRHRAVHPLRGQLVRAATHVRRGLRRASRRAHRRPLSGASCRQPARSWNPGAYSRRSSRGGSPTPTSSSAASGTGCSCTRTNSRWRTRTTTGSRSFRTSSGSGPSGSQRSSRRGRTFTTAGVMTTDAVNGRTRVWLTPRGRSLIGNQRALDIVRGESFPGIDFAEDNNRNAGGRFRVVEPRQVFPGGRASLPPLDHLRALPTGSPCRS